MAETGNPSIVPIGIRRSYLKPGGGMFILPPVPNEFYHHIGAVAVFWGAFEATFDNALRTLIGITNEETSGWEFWPFKRRRRLFARLLSAAFPKPSEIQRILGEVVEKSAEYHRLRNALVHGQHQAVFPKKGQSRYEVRSKSSGRYVTDQFTIEAIERLWHQLGTLHADLSSCFDPETPVSPLRKSDREVLRELSLRFLDGAPRTRQPSSE